MLRLDVGQGLLLRDDERVVLVPKAFELLRVLVEHGGRVVGKDALIAAVWPDVTVEDGNLAKLVFLLRKELGDDAIETVPRRGYRLALAIAVTPPPGSRVDPAAYDLYVHGRYLWNRRPGPVVWQALESFQSAIEIDPMFAPAWAGIADVYSTLGSWEAGVLPHAEAQAKAWSYASRALELDPSLVAAHTTLAYTTLHYAWDLEGADDRFRRALALDDGYAAAHHWHSHALVAAGRFVESLAASRRALDREPMNLLLHVHLAWHWFFAGEPARCLEEAERVVAIDPAFHWGHYFVGWGAEGVGDVARAVDAMRAAHRCSQEDDVMLAGVGRALAIAGDRAGVHPVRERLAARGLYDYELALIALGLGERDEAIAALARAAIARSGWMAYARVDPRLTRVRGELPALAPVTLAR